MLRVREKHWGRIAFNVWLVVFTAVVIWSVVEIQHSRVQSCKDNYEAFNKVFKPFNIPPKQQTPKQAQDAQTFHQTIRELKDQCGKQVHLWSY